MSSQASLISHQQNRCSRHAGDPAVPLEVPRHQGVPRRHPAAPHEACKEIDHLSPANELNVNYGSSPTHGGDSETGSSILHWRRCETGLRTGGEGRPAGERGAGEAGDGGGGGGHVWCQFCCCCSWARDVLRLRRGSPLYFVVSGARATDSRTGTHGGVDTSRGGDETPRIVVGARLMWITCSGWNRFMAGEAAYGRAPLGYVRIRY